MRTPAKYKKNLTNKIVTSEMLNDAEKSLTFRINLLKVKLKQFLKDEQVYGEKAHHSASIMYENKIEKYTKYINTIKKHNKNPDFNIKDVEAIKECVPVTFIEELIGVLDDAQSVQKEKKDNTITKAQHDHIIDICLFLNIAPPDVKNFNEASKWLSDIHNKNKNLRRDIKKIKKSLTIKQN